jgi:hypothetical protein
VGEDSGASQKIGELEPPAFIVKTTRWFTLRRRATMGWDISFTAAGWGAFYPEEIRSVEYPPFFAKDFQTV